MLTEMDTINYYKEHGYRMKILRKKLKISLNLDVVLSWWLNIIDPVSINHVNTFIYWNSHRWTSTLTKKISQMRNFITNIVHFKNSSLRLASPISLMKSSTKFLNKNYTPTLCLSKFVSSSTSTNSKSFSCAIYLMISNVCTEMTLQYFYNKFLLMI